MKTLTPIVIALLFTVNLAPAQIEKTRVDPYTEDNINPGWTDWRDKDSVRPSPNAVAGLQTGFSRIMITYGSPAVKGREFGVELARWDNLWRTGANESTIITTTEDILVEGRLLQAGTYSILSIPGKKEWTIFFNSNPKIWNQQGYDEKNNVLTIKVPHQKTTDLAERLMFHFDEIDTENFSARAVLRWEYFKVSFEIKEI